MLTDQKESGIIESIADGIARISGLNDSFYAELLYTVAIKNEIINNDSDSDSDDTDLLTTTTETPFPSQPSIILRTIHDVLLPFILFNNPNMLTFFENVNSATIDKQEIDVEDVDFNDLEDFLSFEESIFISDNIESLNVDFNLLTNIFEFIIDSNLLDIAEHIIEMIEADDDIIDTVSFAYAYSTTILSISLGIIETSLNNDILSAEIAQRLSKSTINYMSLLSETLATMSVVSILSPDTSEIDSDETISDFDASYNDEEVDEVEELDEELEMTEFAEFNDNEDEGEELSKVALLVMGLEKEYVQAPLLTQTTNIFEGDIVWGTGQELEVYCSFEALGSISDIFLNPIE
jgi:hypothetical protein